MTTFEAICTNWISSFHHSSFVFSSFVSFQFTDIFPRLLFRFCIFLMLCGNLLYLFNVILFISLFCFVFCVFFLTIDCGRKLCIYLYEDNRLAKFCHEHLDRSLWTWERGWSWWRKCQIVEAVQNASPTLLRLKASTEMITLWFLKQ